MSTRKLATGLAIALCAPLAAWAGEFFETTNDEAGSRIVTPRFGAPTTGSAPAASTALRVGEISADRQYVYLGDEGGWQLRPMTYRFEGGGLAHVDDPVGHMFRLADNSPFTPELRLAFQHSRGQ